MYVALENFANRGVHEDLATDVYRRIEPPVEYVMLWGRKRPRGPILGLVCAFIVQTAAAIALGGVFLMLHYGQHLMRHYAH